MQKEEPHPSSSPSSPKSRETQPPETNPASKQSKNQTKTVEIELHGLKAKFLLNSRAEDIIPARYLLKADRLPIVQRTAWLFRGLQDARNVNLLKWSKVDIRFRGVYKTLEKVPRFCDGLYESEDNGRIEEGSRNDRRGGSFDFKDAARRQSHVVYALLEEILGMLDITREAEDRRSYFYLRPRLLNLNLEYWTGYREKYRDAPPTAGLVSLEFFPDSFGARTLIPISTTTSQTSTLTSSLTNRFKHLLSQLLLNIHRLHPPGDQFPDQEVFLIGLHGSKLHIMRAIFPGHKTSRLWSGRHTPSSSSFKNANKTTNTDPNKPTKPNPKTDTHTHTDTHTATEIKADPAHMQVHPQPTSTPNRFYTKHNLERFLQQIEWQRLATRDNDPDLRVFRVLASTEFDLWVRDDFKASIRLLSGLFLYLMSGRARCGVLQDIFEMFPYDDEDDEMSSEEEEQESEVKTAAEEKRVEEEEREIEEMERRSREEDRQWFWTREAMRGEVNDRIGGFREFRQPWWDWVWEEKNEHYDGRPKAADDADAEVIFGGP